jgi:hypothetical protein
MIPVRCLLLLPLALLPVDFHAQVVNGSFEINGQPSLVGWNFTCSGNESYHDSPFDTSGWCLELICGNFQGCFPGIAYQIIQSAKSADIWQLDAWTKPSTHSLPRSIYWDIFPADGSSVISLPRASTLDSGWIHLSVRDTLLINPGDSAAVVLDAGTAGGPFSGWSYFDVVSASKVGTAAVPSENAALILPNAFRLYQNYPNPFNPSTTIRYGLPNRSHVVLTVFNTLGQQVASLVNVEQDAGVHEVKFDGSNLASGVYFYRLAAGDFVQTKRLMLLK